MEPEKQTEAHEQAADAALAKIMDPERSPQAKLARLFRNAAKYAVHPTKQAQAVAILNGLAAEAAGILDRCDYGSIEAFRVKFGSQFYYAGLSTPAVEQTPRERWLPVFLKRWAGSGEECEAAIAMIKRAEIGTVKVNWDSFEVGGRTITREAIRLRLKPRFSRSTDAEWLAKFPQMKRWVVDGNDIVFTGVGSA